MKYHFAGTEGGNKTLVWDFLIKKPYKDVLFSYFYGKSVDWELMKNHNFNVLLDSGAFSAFTQKKVINISDYIDFIYKNPWIKNYITLDVIHNPTATLENLNVFKTNGLKPIPVHHMGSDIKSLYKIIDMGYDFIALGGMAVNAARNRKNIVKFCEEVFKETEHLNLKFHGLGIGSPFICNAFNWYSVDSTSWLSAKKFLRHPFGRQEPILKEMLPYERSILGMTEILKWVYGQPHKDVYSDFLLNKDIIIKKINEKNYE